jgi:hypothetical protein
MEKWGFRTEMGRSLGCARDDTVLLHHHETSSRRRPGSRVFKSFLFSMTPGRAMCCVIFDRCWGRCVGTRDNNPSKWLRMATRLSPANDPALLYLLASCQHALLCGLCRNDGRLGLCERIFLKDTGLRPSPQ